jgi:hypothetical protein
MTSRDTRRHDIVIVGAGLLAYIIMRQLPVDQGAKAVAWRLVGSRFIPRRIFSDLLQPTGKGYLGILAETIILS